MNNIDVRDAVAEQRYEARQGETVVGVLLYELDGDVVTFTHTEVEPQAEGTGVGSTLARRALDDARASGRRVVPACPFVKAWIGRHREYADLVQPSGPVR
ncbi:MAG: GNAT family N-acetyltransferase [Cellulomonas sp. 73-145]|uniref:GNAT family N-acetyltransferase n=1 Tax=Cellulomonas sp. 73-145 TaxID=1895739 RepID=UPI00092C3903|nr:GNAT family N-acetyltransferase [Cellulomonas sp. 73-145]MBN9326151.1 N-acetyltransferase [Cellulomonas sp.]OJV58249.1 MAG: GNAT family N-acetyltransferase [Cellulomonas sp. 73-145]